MKASIEQGLKELRDGLPGHSIQVKEDADGGAFVLVDDLEIGECFQPSSSWVGFHMTWPYPDADVYPHFIDEGVRYVGDGPAPVEHAAGSLPAAMIRGQTMPGFERPAIQVSRRSNRWNPAIDTALRKLLRVVDFLASH